MTVASAYGPRIVFLFSFDDRSCALLRMLDQVFETQNVEVKSDLQRLVAAFFLVLPLTDSFAFLLSGINREMISSSSSASPRSSRCCYCSTR